MTGIKRFTGISLIAAMMVFVMAPSAAIAVEAQTPIGSPYNVTFDATGLVNGSTYDLTVDSTIYHLTAQTGVDYTLSVFGGTTIAVTYSRYAYESAVKRRDIGVQMPPANFNITGPLNIQQGYPGTQYLVSFEQTGLPSGTSCLVSWGPGGQSDIPVPGTSWIPLDTWIKVTYLNPVYTWLGAYNFGSLNIDDSGDGYDVTGPITIIGSYISGSITGTVFSDLNNNRIQDADEPGIPGALVELWGTITPAGGVVGSLGSIGTPASLLSTHSDSNGDYSFDLLPAGAYFVRITLADGSQQNSGNITLNVSGGSIISGQADFPQITELPNAGR